MLFNKVIKKKTLWVYTPQTLIVQPCLGGCSLERSEYETNANPGSVLHIEERHHQLG